MSGLKRWWNDETHKRELTAKAETGSWYVVAGDLPGRVTKIVYAGYKITLSNNTEVIVNPDTLGEKLKDVSVDAFPEFVAIWQAKEDQRLQGLQDAETARVAKLEQQDACQHPTVETRTVVKAAGCDIDDTNCCSCGKVLRRSWSTASDRDPDDHVSDWAWWVREHTRLYREAPNPVNYKVVGRIGDDYSH